MRTGCATEMQLTTTPKARINCLVPHWVRGLVEMVAAEQGASLSQTLERAFCRTLGVEHNPIVLTVRPDGYTATVYLGGNCTVVCTAAKRDEAERVAEDFLCKRVREILSARNNPVAA